MLIAGQSIRSLNIEYRFCIAVTCCNFVGVVGLIAHESRIYIPAGVLALALDFLKSGRKWDWPLFTFGWLLLAGLIWMALRFGLEQMGSSLPMPVGVGAPVDAPNEQAWEAVSILTIFKGLMGDYLNSVVAWSTQRDEQVALARKRLGGGPSA